MTERLKLAEMLAALPLDQSHDTWPTVVPVRLTETDRELIVNVLRAQPQPTREPGEEHPCLKQADELHELGFMAGWNGAVEECSKIAQAIDSGRGNEGEITRAVLALTRPESK